MVWGCRERVKNRFLSGMLVWIMGLLVACSGGTSTSPKEVEKVELSLLAAASLTDAVKEIQKDYENRYPHIKLVPSFASSGKLQKQIEQGVPADLFLSAGGKEMDSLVNQGVIAADGHQDLLQNKLVLIIPAKGKKKVKGFRDLTQVEKVALGQPDTVPAGAYSKQALQYMKLWEQLRSKLVFTGDVRQVLTYVESGNVDAGFVYETDAKTSDQVSVVATANPNTHKPIIYPLGVVKASQHPKEARRLYDYLQGKEAQAVFEKYGFERVQ